jgi:hypothetical protein
VFQTWSVEIPEGFAEAFIVEDAYWHAYDERRSVSLTSIVVTDNGEPVSSELLLRQMPPVDGTPIEELPCGLVGWAVTRAAVEPARATRMLSGILVALGRVLIITITSDDLGWARTIWLSIRHLRSVDPALN